MHDTLVIKSIAPLGIYLDNHHFIGPCWLRQKIRSLSHRLVNAIDPPILVHSHLTIKYCHLLGIRGPGRCSRKVSICISLLLDEAVEGVEIYVLRGSFFVPPGPKAEVVKG